MYRLSILLLLWLAIHIHAADEENICSNVILENSHYGILGVPIDAAPIQIRKAYKLKARETHPDKNLGDPEAEEKFKSVGEAYEILYDTQLRTEYNKDLAEQLCNSIDDCSQKLGQELQKTIPKQPVDLMYEKISSLFHMLIKCCRLEDDSYAY